MTGVLVAAAAAVDAGGRGALGALSGTIVVAAFLSASAAPLRLVSPTGQRAGVAAMALLVLFTARLALAVIILKLLDRAGALSAHWLGITVVACALVWPATQLAVVVRGSRSR